MPSFPERLSFDYSLQMAVNCDIKKNMPKEIVNALLSMDLVNIKDVKIIELRHREGINKSYLAYASCLTDTYFQGLCIYKESSQFTEYSLQNATERKNSQKYSRLANIFRIRHSNVVAYYALVKEESKYSGFLMETVSQKEKTLDDYLNSDEQAVPFERIQKWIIQLAEAIQFCHKNKVVHGDIKPANIFVTDDESAVKLGNFNFDLNPDPTLTIRHSRQDFSAPEVILGSKFSPASDVYSFGMIIYCLLYKRYPFTGTRSFLTNPLNFRQSLESGKRPAFSYNLNLSATLRSLIEDCWRTDSRERPTMDQIIRRLQRTDESFPSVEIEEKIVKMKLIEEDNEEDEWDIIKWVDNDDCF